MPLTPAGSPVLRTASSPAPFSAQAAHSKQVAAIVVIATIVAWLSRFWPAGPWNAIIWIAPPIIIAFLSNKGAPRLVLALFFGVIFAATIISNEVAAHLLFATCLYD